MTGMDWETARVWIKIGLIFFILTLLAVLDVARKDFGTLGKKAAWGVIALVPFIGWLIYFIFGFRKGKKPALSAAVNDPKL